MIFVILGSQKFQFNRLLEEIDKLIENQKITETVIAQIGASTYVPKHFVYQNFYDREEFENEINKADIVLVHGGTGSIISSVKKGKKVIAVPRLKKYGEHVDDHQIEIIEQFDELNLICPCYNLQILAEKIISVRECSFAKYSSNTNAIIESIERFIS